MFTGLTIANIAGVPLGTLIGQPWLGRDILRDHGLGVLSLIAVALLIPGVSGKDGIDVRREFAVARRPQVLLALATTALGWG